MKKALTIFLLLGSLVGFSQPDPNNPSGSAKDNINLGYKLGKSKFYFNYNIITPSGLVYFDLGTDAPLNSNNEAVEPDFYNDGNSNFNLQIISGDLFYGESWFRGGLNLGLGVSTSQGNTDESGFVIGNLGLACTFNQNVRIETGFSLGISAKESYDKISDSAFYIGLSLPTQIGENIKKAITKN